MQNFEDWDGGSAYLHMLLLVETGMASSALRCGDQKIHCRADLSVSKPTNKPSLLLSSTRVEQATQGIFATVT